MSKSLFQFQFFALGGPNEVKLYAETSAEAHTLFDAIRKEVLRIEKKYSRYDPQSILSRINADAGHRKSAIDEETHALLNYAQLAFVQTKGLFDITSGVLRRAWDFSSGTTPSQAAINELLALVGFESLEISDQSIFLPRQGMEIDFGGFGKEYAVDRAAAIALQSGASGVLVNLAGDVRVVGPQADGSPWSIGISHPRKTNEVLTAIQLYEGAIASSGDYERYVEVDGQRYCHLLNPNTGWPAQEMQSVSVLAETCLLAGTLATEAMISAEVEAKKKLKRSGCAYLFVGKDGKRYASAGLKTKKSGS